MKSLGVASNKVGLKFCPECGKYSLETTGRTYIFLGRQWKCFKCKYITYDKSRVEVISELLRK